MAERTLLSSRSILICALAALLGAVCGAQWQKRALVTSPAAPLAPRVVAGVTPAGFGPVVELGPLDAPEVTIRPDSDDIFRYRESPAAREKREADERRAARQKKLEEHARASEAKRLQDEMIARQNAEAKWEHDHPKPPAVTFALIGKIGAPRSPIAVFSGRSGEVFTARVGETVAGGFKLLALDYDSATVGCADRLVAAHPDWAREKTLLRMGAR